MKIHLSTVIPRAFKTVREIAEMQQSGVFLASSLKDDPETAFMLIRSSRNGKRLFQAVNLATESLFDAEDGLYFHRFCEAELTIID